MKNNKLATLIECSPGKNIIYTMSEIEGKLICDMLESYRIIHGKYPKISEMIDYVLDNPKFFGNQLFKNVKIEEKEIKDKIKGETSSYVHLDDFDLYDRFVNGKRR